ncbi:hypothetical protein TWF481_001668 [Arthrobotrys musiformis]|uniref:Uncharacterized protein n=1 Tax=Arthrobotrys musiformis TaxID=47236 RepID=A0AAV9VU32_9PEZI
MAPGDSRQQPVAPSSSSWGFPRSPSPLLMSVASSIHPPPPSPTNGPVYSHDSLANGLIHGSYRPSLKRPRDEIEVVGAGLPLLPSPPSPSADQANTEATGVAGLVAEGTTRPPPAKRRRLASSSFGLEALLPPNRFYPSPPHPPAANGGQGRSLKRPSGGSEEVSVSPILAPEPLTPPVNPLQKGEHPGSPMEIESSALPSSPPVRPAPQEGEVEVIDLTGIPTPVASDQKIKSIWSCSSASSGSITSTMSNGGVPALRPPQVLLPPHGPMPLGTDWELLGPLDEFPVDPFSIFYEPPLSHPFPKGTSSDIISANPELAFLFNIKAEARERWRKRPISESDSLELVQSTLTTQFFAASDMDGIELRLLDHDMKLARKIGFLPFEGQKKAVEAVKRYTKGNQERERRRRDPTARRPRDRRFPQSNLYEGIHPHERGNDGHLLLLPEDWYPGDTFYKDMVKKTLETNPYIRSGTGVPGFRCPMLWGTRPSKALRKFNWEKWEADILREVRAKEAFRKF